jgi:DNA repair photolyase
MMNIEMRERKSPFIHLNDKANTYQGIVCEPFYVLSYYIGCPFACTYCYLQGTFRGQVDPVLYRNRGRLLAELETWLALPGHLRLNAGELEDSLALDGKIPLVDDLVPRFLAQERHTLLLVTKSTNVKNLLKYHPTDHVIVAFSVNCLAAWQLFEKKTPHPYQRLEAAAQVSAAGYITVLRLDPMLPVANWQDEYAELIDHAYSLFRPHQWTLGSLRFFPTLPMWTAKVGRSTQVYNFGVEASPEDRRRRLKTPLRLAMYRHAIGLIRWHDVDVPIRLCKETVGMHQALNMPIRGCCYNTPLSRSRSCETSEVSVWQEVLL